MGKIYMIGSQKGGTAKTTTTFNLRHHQMPDGIIQHPRILHTEARCQICLAVKIHCQDPLPHLPQAVRQIERSRGLCRTTFL